ncbi:hypothetical protein ACDT10_24450 [Mycobacterium intracellulare]|uniref:hypothetical protein n=1 Tax=Mycobacterium intracellulare TaxID=1767 RepID=UPI003558F7BF
MNAQTIADIKKTGSISQLFRPASEMLFRKSIIVHGSPTLSDTSPELDIRIPAILGSGFSCGETQQLITL